MSNSLSIDPMEAALQGKREIVIDACLVGNALIGDTVRKALARRFFAACSAMGVGLSVPPLFLAESDTVLRQSVRRAGVDVSQLPALFAALDALPINVATDAIELQAVRLRARQIAAMLDQPDVYDATYAALAEGRGCDFWTDDKRFANAAHQVRRAPDGTTGPTLAFVRFIGGHSTPATA